MMTLQDNSPKDNLGYPIDSNNYGTMPNKPSNPRFNLSVAAGSRTRRGRNGHSISVLSTERRHSSLAAGAQGADTPGPPFKIDSGLNRVGPRNTNANASNHDSLVSFLELKIEQLEVKLKVSK